MKRMSNGFPLVIQGGMGVGVSNWRLAQAVSQRGQLGVVSGTALDQVLVRRLQDGDPGGHMRRALAAFPCPAMAERIVSDYFLPGGRAAGVPYRVAPMQSQHLSHASTELCIVSNFVEVFLAREGHANPVGMNYLEKIQTPHLPSIYGAMLAGVGYIIMGAGIPLRIPGVLDRLALHQPVEYALSVTGAHEGDDVMMRFNPIEYIYAAAPLQRPRFLAIVSSHTLAATMVKKANGVVDGLVLEMNHAGGHNAPPRGRMQLSDAGEPVYGERDRIDMEKVRELGVPFWLAGGYGSAAGLQSALLQGATGVQVGTAFEFADESGLDADLKSRLMAKAIAGTTKVVTDAVASPTGFPFKLVQLEGTASDPSIAAMRPRICDLGFLREAYRMDDGAIGYRCPSEPLSLYRHKGGAVENTAGRRCLCNGLMANVGLAQSRNGNRTEPALVTAGDDLCHVPEFLRPGQNSYGVAEVLDSILVGADDAVEEETAAAVG